MKTAICIASGESLTQDDVDYCKGKGVVYVVNDVYKICPWADYFYAADKEWWEFHIENVKPLRGEKYCLNSDFAEKNGLNYVQYDTSIAWSDNPEILATGGNSGFQALNLADLHGYDRIILLGYDMGFDHKKHFFGDHPQKINRASQYGEWIKRFDRAKPYIKANVINCTVKTRLECFERANLRDVL